MKIYTWKFIVLDGFENPAGLWKLNKTIYGLKQAGKMRNNKKK